MSMFGDDTPMQELWESARHVQRVTKATGAQMVAMLSHVLSVYTEYELLEDRSDADEVNAELSAEWQKRFER